MEFLFVGMPVASFKPFVGGYELLKSHHQPVDVDLRLRCLPRRAFHGHVRPILLAGVRCFF